MLDKGSSRPRRNWLRRARMSRPMGGCDVTDAAYPLLGREREGVQRVEEGVLRRGQCECHGRCMLRSLGWTGCLCTTCQGTCGVKSLAWMGAFNMHARDVSYQTASIP